MKRKLFFIFILIDLLVIIFFMTPDNAVKFSNSINNINQADQLLITRNNLIIRITDVILLNNPNNNEQKIVNNIHNTIKQIDENKNPLDQANLNQQLNNNLTSLFSLIQQNPKFRNNEDLIFLIKEFNNNTKELIATGKEYNNTIQSVTKYLKIFQ